MFGMSKNDLTGDVLMELFVKLDEDGSGDISKDELRQGMVTTYRRRRRHVHCAGMAVPVLEMTASPARPYPRNGTAVGDAEMRAFGCLDVY